MKELESKAQSLLKFPAQGSAMLSALVAGLPEHVLEQNEAIQELRGTSNPSRILELILSPAPETEELQMQTDEEWKQLALSSPDLPTFAENILGWFEDKNRAAERDREIEDNREAENCYRAAEDRRQQQLKSNPQSAGPKVN